MGMFRNKFILILIQGKVVKEPLKMTPSKLLKNEFFLKINTIISMIIFPNIFSQIQWQSLLSENCFLHRLKHTKYVVCEPLFFELLQPLVNPLKTSIKYWTILYALNAEAICWISIRSHNCYNASSLFGHSRAFDSHNVYTLFAFSYA